MAKFTPHQKLPPPKEDELLLELCTALVAIKKPVEAAHFLKDLFSVDELRMIAKRLKIARCLLRDMGYTEIQDELHVSPGTVARVNAWLHGSGEGYRLIAERTEEEPLHRTKLAVVEKETSWPAEKRRVSLYNWPAALITEILHRAKKEELRKLQTCLSTLRTAGQKKRLFRNIERALRDLENRVR